MGTLGYYKILELGAINSSSCGGLACFACKTDSLKWLLDYNIKKQNSKEQLKNRKKKVSKIQKNIKS